MNGNRVCALVAAAALALAIPGAVQAADAGPSEASSAAAAVKPKPLSANVSKGLAWVAKHQLKSGAWGQGEESAAMGGGASFKDTPSVGDTCMVLLALMRAGNTPEKGPYARQVASGVRYVCGRVQESDADSLLITKTGGTRIQQKLGRYIDTFLACTMLAEVQEKTTDKALVKLVARAVEKIVRKMEKNQRPDGTWGQKGWAQALEQQMAVKGMNMAARAGVKVDETVRQRAAAEAQKRFDAKSGQFAAKGSAGVELYAASSSLGAQADTVAYDAVREKDLRDRLSKAKKSGERAAIEKDLGRLAENRRQLEATTQAVVKKLQDDRFVSGFGSNGGEEFLSYLTIGEALIARGKGDWVKWDRKMTENMNRIQNADGSWTGHHCITGRTFCTSAALLVLMVDRAPAPLAAKIQRR